MPNGNGSRRRTGINLTTMFTLLSSAEHVQSTARENGQEPCLESKLRFLNSKLLSLNDEIQRLENQRDSVRLKLRHTAWALQIQGATEIKHSYANGKCV
jgi:hypothetical protein